MRDRQISLAEKKFVLQSLSKRTRLDKRSLATQRKINIQCSKTIPGTCLVSLGRTRVLIQTNYKIEEPREIRPVEGRHRIKIEESTAPVYEDVKNNKNDSNRNNPYSDITELLEQAFIKSKSLDLESLCIRAGTNSFTIESKLSILSDDGSLADCCSIAVAVGLRHFKLPTTIIEGENVTINSNSKKSLAIFHLPYLVTLATFPNLASSSSINEQTAASIRKTKVQNANLDEEIGEMVLDPTKLEAKLCNGSITLAINKHKELCGMKTQGGICLSMADITRAYKLASFIVKDRITVAIEDSLVSSNQVEEFDFTEDPNVDYSTDTSHFGNEVNQLIGMGRYQSEVEQMNGYDDDDDNQTMGTQTINGTSIKREAYEESSTNDDLNVDGGLVKTEMPSLIDENDWGIDELITSVREEMEN